MTPAARSPSSRVPAAARQALFGLLAVAATLATVRAVAQAGAQGSVEHIRVHSPSLEGNLQGNPAERDVFVYLPPGYRTSPDRRFPVVYLLHGWLPGGEQWVQTIDLAGSAASSLAAGTSREMIIVVPDTITIHGGSMYSTSITTGDFEGFVARDLVAAIDGRFRTLAARESRGLSGHLMGGYGTWRIAMKHPEQWSSFYALNSCCLGPYSIESGSMTEASKITTLEEAAAAGIGTRVLLTLAAAWSPNPGKPPLYFDLPIEGGELMPLALTKWNANVPLAMIDQYIPALRTFDAIGIDIGTEDSLLGVNTELSQVLTAYGIDHVFETYEGNHRNRVGERIETHVLPFFSSHLAFE